MSAINVPFDLNNTNIVIPVDRWGDPEFTVQVESGAGTVLVESTLARINRGETPVWATAFDKAGVGITVQAIGIVGLQSNPYEAIRITATGAAIGRLMQTGAPQ